MMARIALVDKAASERRVFDQTPLTDHDNDERAARLALARKHESTKPSAVLIRPLVLRVSPICAECEAPT